MVQSKTIPLQQFTEVVQSTVNYIHDFTKSPKDFTRNRKLNAETTLTTILNMQGQSINAELLNMFPNAEDRMSESAFEQAKAKLKPDIFRHLFDEFNATKHIHNTLNLTTSYSVYAIDGCDFNTPYFADSDYKVDYQVGRPRNDGTDNKPFSMIHANMLYDIINRKYVDCVLQPRTKMNEREAAIEMIKRIPNDKPFIVIVDRGYTGFNFIETLNRIPNCHYIVRTKVTKGAINGIKALPDEDCDKDMVFMVTSSTHYYKQNKNTENLHLIHHTKTHYKSEISKNTKDNRWAFEQFCNIKCRVVKLQINEPDREDSDEYEVLIPNLNHFEFPLKEMKRMYHLRWGIATSFLELKYAVGAINFHSKKDEFIVMELYSHFIM